MSGIIWCNNLCRYRTGRLLYTVALRLRKHTRRVGAFHAWNKCLAHLLTLARAHIESIAYETFVQAARACPDVDCRKSLKARLVTYLCLDSAFFWSSLVKRINLCYRCSGLGMHVQGKEPDVQVCQ